MANIILIGGKAGSGKDTVAEFLVNNCNFTQFAYANALKDYVSVSFNINRQLFDTQEGKMSEIIVNNRKTTPRQMLIDVSLEKKKENPLIWIQKVIESIKICDNKQVVISDFRFPEEYTELIKIFDNVITIQIKRNEALNIDDHSERALNNFKFDYIIYNNSSKEDLYKKVLKIII